MKKSVILSLLLVFAAVICFAGCTGTSGNGGGNAGSAATAAPTQAGGSSPTPFAEPTSSSDLIPGPTSQPDPKYEVAVDANKDDVYGNIDVTFRGGKGQNFVNTITVDAYLADGTHVTKTLDPSNVGNSVQFNGHKFDQDRIKVTVLYQGNIGTYVIYDELIPKKLSQRARD
ncbi:MAG: hypothetical protein IK060_05085 [Methanomicrobium sp.]|nr:hypothetical protein [Methanomicrobium sp.]MBR6011693.1 hypothetical protein [Methanomicrobium sp.]MBR6497191.1 hypothetical protein [Methanomicrobium sp.]